MYIFLLIFAAALYASTIKDYMTRNLVFLILLLGFIYNACLYLEQPTKKLHIYVEPNSKVMLWSDKLKVYNGLFGSIYSNELTSDDTGKVYFYVHDDTYTDVEYPIYFRYIMGNRMSVVNTTYVNKEVAPAPSSYEEPNIVRVERTVHETSDLMKQVKVMEKIEKKTLRRTSDIMALETIPEENTDDLETENNLDKYFPGPIVDTKEFDRPLEAILDDRNFQTKIDHDMVYENACNMGKSFHKFT